MKPYVIAHRGDSGTYPENTLLAFRKAIEAGADWIELDVIATRDDVVIVSHDTRADRCTDGTGYFCDMTLEQVKQLNASIGSATNGIYERIPTLNEALDCIGYSARICIEIKGDTISDYIRHAQQTVEILQERDAIQYVVITSFNSDCLQAIKTWEPRLATALDPDKQDGTYSPWQLCTKVLDCGANFLLHRHETLTSEIIDECHQHGFDVWTWTADLDEDMSRAIILGADAIMTNYPSQLGQIINNERIA